MSAAEQPTQRYDDGIITTAFHEQELGRLQTELIKLQSWVDVQELRVVVLFEGRDAAGKREMIQQLTERLNPRMLRTVALGKPCDRESRQWYFQRYESAFVGVEDVSLVVGHCRQNGQLSHEPCDEGMIGYPVRLNDRSIS